MFKIATWNVNSLKMRLPQLLPWLTRTKPDIVALQETKVTDENFPHQAIIEAGYQVVFAGQKTFNGVAILSRAPAQEVTTEIPDWQDTQRRLIAATIAGVRVINLYVPNGENVESEKYRYKLQWLAKVHDFLQQQLAQYTNLVVLGDFNIAPEDRDVHDPERWRGHVLCSEPERQAFRELLAIGLQDTFRLFPEHPVPYTWWDYRGGALWRNEGLRIDHILASAALAEHCTQCEVDKSLRKQKPPSDHAAIVATFSPTTTHEILSVD
ncbi:MAG: exodeoxyribonuclease III [Gammaproteobacteria bacterium]